MTKRIEICGNIASGKTTLCNGFLSLNYRAIFENFQSNPFFEAFYQDPVGCSFETELTFLLQHYHDIKKESGGSLFVCDYSLLQDIAYADINLSGERLRIFQETVKELHTEIGQPEKIIHLVCSEETLLERIIKRSREAETSISIDYLRSLSQAIQNRIDSIASETEVITIDSESIDFRPGIEPIQQLQPYLT